MRPIRMPLMRLSGCRHRPVTQSRPLAVSQQQNRRGSNGPQLLAIRCSRPPWMIRWHRANVWVWMISTWTTNRSCTISTTLRSVHTYSRRYCMTNIYVCIDCRSQMPEYKRSLLKFARYCQHFNNDIRMSLHP